MTKFLGKLLFPKAPPYLQIRYARELLAALVVGAVLAMVTASGLYFNYLHHR